MYLTRLTDDLGSNIFFRGAGERYPQTYAKILGPPRSRAGNGKAGGFFPDRFGSFNLDNGRSNRGEMDRVRSATYIALSVISLGIAGSLLARCSQEGGIAPIIRERADRYLPTT